MLMLGTAILAVKVEEGRSVNVYVVAVTGLFGVVFLSGQSIITIDDEQMARWRRK